jgi:hypothetical protein
VLITQRSRVQIPPPLPRPEALSRTEKGPFACGLCTIVRPAITYRHSSLRHSSLRLPACSALTLCGLMTTDEILAEHPDLTADDIHESLLYAAEAAREPELPLRHTA